MNKNGFYSLFTTDDEKFPGFVHKKKLCLKSLYNIYTKSIFQESFIDFWVKLINQEKSIRIYENNHE